MIESDEIEIENEEDDEDEEEEEQATEAAEARVVHMNMNAMKEQLSLPVVEVLQVHRQYLQVYLRLHSCSIGFFLSVFCIVTYSVSVHSFVRLFFFCTAFRCHA